jgi:hypothetical protein
VSVQQHASNARSPWVSEGERTDAEKRAKRGVEVQVPT